MWFLTVLPSLLLVVPGYGLTATLSHCNPGTLGCDCYLYDSDITITFVFTIASGCLTATLMHIVAKITAIFEGVQGSVCFALAHSPFHIRILLLLPSMPCVLLIDSTCMKDCSTRPVDSDGSDD